INCCKEAIDLKAVTPESHADLAFLIMCAPDPGLRNAAKAAEHARKAVEYDAASASAWQALGWALFRTGEFRKSVECLEKSCSLQEAATGDAGQWIVLALAHGKLSLQAGLPELERKQHETEFRRRFELASKQIDSWWRARPSHIVDQGIWDFRQEARD